MLVSSITQSIKTMIFRPQVMLPIIIIILASLLFSNLTIDYLGKVQTDLILNFDDISGDVNVLSFLLVNYPLEILLTIGSGLILAVISLIGVVYLARVTKGDSITDAINDTVLEWKNALWLTLTVAGVMIAYIALTFVISIVTSSNAILSLILNIMLVLLLVLMFIKFAFAVPALADGETAKKALQKSWVFSNEHFAKTVVFLIIVVLATLLIGYVADRLVFTVGDTFFPIISILKDSVSATFYGLAIGYYYFSK